MSGFWSIIVPEAATNLCNCPSFEAGSGGWTRSGTNTIGQSSAQAFKGAYSLLCTYQDNTILASLPVTTLATTTTYYLSAWVYVPATWDGGNIRLGSTNYAGASETYNHIYTQGTSPTAQWVYLETVLVTAADGSGTIDLECTSAPTAGRTCYLDAVQIEANTAHATSYCDGEQAGCTWLGVQHLSTSERSAQERSGGNAVNLDSLSAYVVEIGGAGMPGIAHHSQPQAFLPGAIFTGDKVLPRTLLIVLEAIGTSRANLHSVRKTLINYIKPDAVKGAQPFRLRYEGANSTKPVEISCVYAGGLEMGRLDGHSERIALKVIAYDPFWYELGDGSQNITAATSSTDAWNIFCKVDGTWNDVGGGLNDAVYALSVGPDNNLYAGGAFTESVSSSDTALDYIAKWSGSAWSKLGTSDMNGAVNALAWSPAADLYVGGVFTSADTVSTANRVAKWNPTDVTAGTGVWEALGDGCDSDVYALAWGKDDKLYIGGNFIGGASSDVAPTTDCPYVTRWSGADSDYQSLGTGMNGAVYALARARTGDIIAGGAFTTAGGTTVNKVARWSDTAWTWTGASQWNAMGAGVGTASTDIVYAVYAAPDGTVYAGGSFTGTAGNYFSIWNGVFWRAVPNIGLNGTVRNIIAAPDGGIWIAGGFTNAWGQTVDGLAQLQGGSVLDVDLPAGTVYAQAWNAQGDYFIGYGSTDNVAYHAATATATNNGTRKVYPIITVKRSGGATAFIKWVRNETTGHTLYFGGSNFILDGETLVVDLTLGKRSVYVTGISQNGDPYRQTRLDALLPNSDFAEFCLLPGSNTISAYIWTTGSPTMTMNLSYPLTHWSVDGAST